MQKMETNQQTVMFRVNVFSLLIYSQRQSQYTCNNNNNNNYIYNAQIAYRCSNAHNNHYSKKLKNLQFKIKTTVTELYKK